MPQPPRDEQFSIFVRDHRVQLLRAACLLTAGDTHAAEDLVQAALIRVYIAWPRLRDHPVTYTRRVIINIHIDQTRRPWWRRERSMSDVSEVSESAQPVGALPWSEAQTGPLDQDRVRAALAALPPRMRAAVVLRHWLDLSVQESAELLGCSTGTVKSQTAKGIARLRDLLADGDALITSGSSKALGGLR